MSGLYMVVCQGYPNIYVMAASFDDARKEWLDEYINIDDGTGLKLKEEDCISVMPDTIAFLAPREEVIL